MLITLVAFSTLLSGVGLVLFFLDFPPLAEQGCFWTPNGGEGDGRLGVSGEDELSDMYLVMGENLMQQPAAPSNSEKRLSLR
jgi:hypothetical protein